MAQAPQTVRTQVAALASAELEGRLDWGDFLQSLPEDIGEDEVIHELIEVLQSAPPSDLVSADAYGSYKARVRELITQLEGRSDGAI